MCETQKVDQPEHHHPANEGLLTDEEDAGEDEGEEEAEHWHHHSELEIVHQNSPNWNKYYLDNIYDGPGSTHVIWRDSLSLRSIHQKYWSAANGFLSIYLGDI